MERWSGKTAVVTGASAGIGAGISVALANAGLRVVGLARRANLIDELNSKVTGAGSIHSKQCDILDVEQIAESFKWIEEKFGGTDILVNNVGYLADGYITDLGNPHISDAGVATTIDLNFKALVICSRHAVSSMKNRQFDGHIININSVLGHVVLRLPIPYNIYPSTKHAVTAFTTSLQYELAEMNSHIKVTSISPGIVNTDMGQKPISIGCAALEVKEVVSAVIYAVATPPHVNVLELTLSAYDRHA